MSQRIILLALALGLVAPGLWAQDIQTVWEHTLIDSEKVLPILVNGPPDPRWHGNPEDAPWYGVNLHDQYDGFVRYDENRLLLGVRDNGIDETDPNHDAALAAQYPDRSLLWINAGDGTPAGIALVVGHEPVQISDHYKAMIRGEQPDPQVEGWNGDGGARIVGPGTDVYAPEYMAFDVSESGSIYLGYWYFVLRYDPDGNGGFTGPTTVYEHDYVNHGGTQRVQQWRFGDVELQGSGAEMRAVLAGKTWRNGMHIRVFDVDASDPNNEVWTIRGAYGETQNGSFGQSGGVSKIVSTVDGDEVIYEGSNVTAGGVRRHFWAGDTYEADVPEVFEPRPPMEDADRDIYALPTRFSTDVATHEDLDYIVVATVPSWAQQNSAEVDIPGFITAYSVVGADPVGEFISNAVFGGTKERPPVESDEPAARGDNAAVWNAIMGHIEVNRMPGFAQGASEVLYLSDVYGYGRYVIGDTNVGEWSLY